MPTSNHSKQILIGHVRYINILTWIWAFQDKLLYLVSFGNWETKETFKKNHFWPESLGAMLEYWYIECGQTQSHCARHLFCSQVFKMSDVLNSDENIINIALIAFCSLAVTKLAHCWCRVLRTNVAKAWAKLEMVIKNFPSYFVCS